MEHEEGVLTWCALVMAAGARALELLLGSQSGYVREIVTEELAKGLDAYWRLSTDDALDTIRANLVTLLGVCPIPCPVCLRVPLSLALTC